MCDIMEKYRAQIRAENHAKIIAEYADIVKNAAVKLRVREEDAINWLGIPEEYRKGITEILSHSR